MSINSQYKCAVSGRRNRLGDTGWLPGWAHSSPNHANVYINLCSTISLMGLTHTNCIRLLMTGIHWARPTQAFGKLSPFSTRPWVQLPGISFDHPFRSFCVLILIIINVASSRLVVDFDLLHFQWIFALQSSNRSDWTSSESNSSESSEYEGS